MSGELTHKTVERFCEQFCHFADPVNTDPGLKQTGDEQTGRLWVHGKGVKVKTKHGINVSQLCVFTRSLVKENCGKQPFTHTNGTFCGGNVVVAVKKSNTRVVMRKVRKKLNVMKPNGS